MGTGTVDCAVADAGPLIHLAEIGGLSLLQLFGRLYIPEAVWLETVGQNRVSEDDLLNLTRIERQFLALDEVNKFVQDHDLHSLHPGEQESLFVCLQMDAEVLLTDDLAVRETAKRLKLVPVGSLGIVIKA